VFANLSAFSIKPGAFYPDIYCVQVAVIIAIALGAFVILSWLFGRRSGTYFAPGMGPVGVGIALIAVGGVLVGKGHVIAGALLDLVGAVSIWAAFKTVGGGE
jgi:hypothetical protein